jgi:hypothetical protein
LDDARAQIDLDFEPWVVERKSDRVAAGFERTQEPNRAHALQAQIEREARAGTLLRAVLELGQRRQRPEQRLDRRYLGFVRPDFFPAQDEQRRPAQPIVVAHDPEQLERAPRNLLVTSQNRHRVQAPQALEPSAGRREVAHQHYRTALAQRLPNDVGTSGVFVGDDQAHAGDVQRWARASLGCRLGAELRYRLCRDG